MKKDLPERKPTRLKGYDYSTPGAYFITICIKDRQQLLSKIVGDDEGIVPYNIVILFLIKTIKGSRDLAKAFYCH